MNAFISWAINNPRKYVGSCIAIAAVARFAWAGGNINHWLNPLWPWFV